MLHTFLRLHGMYWILSLPVPEIGYNFFSEPLFFRDVSDFFREFVSRFFPYCFCFLFLLLLLLLLSASSFAFAFCFGFCFCICFCLLLFLMLLLFASAFAFAYAFASSDYLLCIDTATKLDHKTFTLSFDTQLHQSRNEAAQRSLYLICIAGEALRPSPHPLPLVQKFPLPSTTPTISNTSITRTTPRRVLPQLPQLLFSFR